MIITANVGAEALRDWLKARMDQPVTLILPEREITGTVFTAGAGLASMIVDGALTFVPLIDIGAAEEMEAA